MNVEIRFNSGLGDLDLELYNSQQQFLDGSYGSQDGEKVTLATEKISKAEKAGRAGKKRKTIKC